MSGTDLSLRRSLRKALGALEYEHAGEMLSPRQKMHVLDHGEQANTSFLTSSRAMVFMRNVVSRVSFVSEPVTMLKKRVVRSRA